MRVCVVDDCQETTDVLCEGLSSHHYEAIPAYSGEEALRICSGEPVDLVLLDVSLPGLDGYEVCRRLKADPRTANTAIVFISANKAGDLATRAKELGADGSITKPFSLPMVMVRVNEIISRKLAGPHPMPSSEASHTDPLTGLYNKDYLLRRFREEMDKARRYSYPLSCVALDITEMEPMDAEMGGASIDDILAEMAVGIRDCSRAHDIIGRFDSTVLAVVLPHCNADSACAYARKILSEVSGVTFSDPCLPTRAYLSVGVTTCSDAGHTSADQMLGEAMRGLLQAGTNGNGKFVFSNLAANG